LPGHSQQVIQKQLLGSWALMDTTHGKMVFEFADNIHYILLTERPHIIVKNIGTYTIENQENISKLIMNCDTTIISIKMKCDTTYPQSRSRFFIKLEKINTIKLQIAMGQTDKWVLEDQNNTGIYIKQKLLF
jgi:hypothetical protein